MRSITSISLSKETRDKLVLLGKKNDTFDQIIIQLLETAKLEN